ncbi:hypothetical protein GCM10027093_70700 [Paraburkholderia jirisanensis]
MNPVCIVSAPIGCVDDGASLRRQSAKPGLRDCMNAAVEQGASVLDLGAIVSRVRAGVDIGDVVRAVGEIRKVYPQAILQVAAHSVSELIVLIEGFAQLAPDLVSVPLPILCSDDARVLLRSVRVERKLPLRSRLLLDVHDLSMVFGAATMQHEGLLDGPLRMNFCFGQALGVPPDRHAFTFFVQTLKRLAPDAVWSGMGQGKSELELARWSLEMGGHCRAAPARHNAARDSATVPRVMQLCKEYGRRPASFVEARHALSLDGAVHASVV